MYSVVGWTVAESHGNPTLSAVGIDETGKRNFFGNRMGTSDCTGNEMGGK